MRHRDDVAAGVLSIDALDRAAHAVVQIHENFRRSATVSSIGANQ